MGSECSSSSLHGSVDCNVVNNAFLDIKSLSLSIGLQVLEQGQDVFGRFFRPSSLSKLEMLSLSSSTNVTSVSLVGDALLVFEHIFHVSDCLLELQSLDSVSSFESVLVVSSQVVDLGLGG